MAKLKRILKSEDLEEKVLKAKARHLYLKTRNINETARLLDVSPWILRRLLTDVTAPTDVASSSKNSWKDAADSLMKKGYHPIELGRILCKRINCKATTARLWFMKRHTPNFQAQQAIIELDQELASKDILPWEKAADELLEKGYTIVELVQELSKHVRCRYLTARNWFRKIHTPDKTIQKLIIEMNQKLPSLVSSSEISWEEAADALLTKGYRPAELAKILSQQVPFKESIIMRWLAQKNVRRSPKSLRAKEAIINLNEELPSLISKEHLIWEDAIDNLLAKGYSKPELARLLCERISCNKKTAWAWFAKQTIPNLMARKAIAELNKELKKKRNIKRYAKHNPGLEDKVLRAKARKLYLSGFTVNQISKRLKIGRQIINQWIVGLQFDWKLAVNQLLNKGYKIMELGYLLSNKVGCEVDTARRWFAKSRVPPPSMQQEIILLNRELPGQEIWEKAVNELLAKGYNKMELAKILCQRIKCKPTTAQYWFSKKTGNRPSAESKFAIIALNKELKSKPWIGKTENWEKALNESLTKGYSANELGRILAEKTGYHPIACAGFFRKRFEPTPEIQYAIIQLNRKLKPKPKLERSMTAVRQLQTRGYTNQELAQLVCQKIKCNEPKRIINWLVGRGTPPIEVQDFLIELNRQEFED